MGKRFKFKCWNCGRKYTLFSEITEEQQLIVACPYCSAEGVVDLEPFRKRTKTVLRGEGGQEETAGFELQLPDVLPTQKRE